MNVVLLKGPSDSDWMDVKRRALVTTGLSPISPPDDAWKHAILEARHSPVRYLRFSFQMEVKSWIATHLARHVHSQPYILSQRDDRTGKDRDSLPQSQPVNMIYDVNAEELMVIANKRLCSKAHPETREVVERMCEAVLLEYPEFDGLLVPMCEYHGGICHEINPCGRQDRRPKGQPQGPLSMQEIKWCRLCTHPWVYIVNQEGPSGYAMRLSKKVTMYLKQGHISLTFRDGTYYLKESRHGTTWEAYWEDPGAVG